MSNFRDGNAQHQLVMEPPQAKETVTNLIRHRKRFAVEIDASLAKDAICVAVGGELAERETEDYARDMVLRTRDEASQFAMNCIDNELCFDCKAVEFPDKRVEYNFTIERNKRHAARRGYAR